MVAPIDASLRAERIWLKIQRKPQHIVFTVPRRVHGDGTVTPEHDLEPQTVRVVSDNRATVVEGVAGQTPQRHVVLYGVKGHPDAAVPDTDVDEGYRFSIGNDGYRVIDIIDVPGGVQALAVAG